MKKKIFSALMLVFVILSSCKSGENIVKPSPNTVAKDTQTNINTTAAAPSLTGKLVYHSYSCYACSGTKMFIYNFSTNTLTWISQNWNIDYPMNAHFSPDGTKIVFMGQPAGSGDWDIYLWTVGSSSAPTNLTAANGIRDEDPKFSPNGYRICFKQAGDLKIMDLTGTITNTVTSTANVEEGMPYYNDDATGLLYAQGAASASDIYMINIDGTNNTALANVSGVQEYYPIKIDNVNFLYTRWYSSTNKNDQVYMGYFNSSTRTRLPFNTTNDNYSDAYPCGSNYVILSSTKSGGSGGYDLYIANKTSGAIWSLSTYNTNINSSVDELGSCYTPN